MTDDERIDLVMSEMVKIGNGRLSVQKFLAESVKDDDPHSYQRIISFLVDRGFAKKLSTIPVLEILPDGRDIVTSGGYIKYIDKLKQDKEEEARLRKINANLDELNLRKAGFEYKWRWLSVAAIIISIVALIISIAK
jgi:hypothetical protein